MDASSSPDRPRLPQTGQEVYLGPDERPNRKQLRQHSSLIATKYGPHIGTFCLGAFSNLAVALRTLPDDFY